MDAIANTCTTVTLSCLINALTTGLNTKAAFLNNVGLHVGFKSYV